jgi:hypothetical protein
MAKTNRIKALVVVEGGVVSDVLSLHPVEYEVWDWDDFNDAPSDYYDNHPWKDDLKELLSADAYSQILEEIGG